MTDKELVDILRISDDPSKCYAADRIEALAGEVAELRDRDRVLSHQLDLRAQGKDAFTQAIMRERDDLLDSDKQLRAEVERITAQLAAIAEYGTTEINAAVKLRQALVKERAEVERLKAEQSHPVVGLALEDCQRAESERDALRAVLEGLRAFCEDNFDVRDGSDGPRRNEFMDVVAEMDDLMRKHGVKVGGTDA